MLIRFLFLLCFIFCFLGDFVIPIGFGIPVFFVVSSIFLLSIKPKYILKKISQLYKSPLKIFFYLIVWMIFGILFSLLTGKFSLSGFISSFVGGLFFTILIPILITNIAFEKIISAKRLIRLSFTIFFIIFLLGIVQFFGYYFKISIIEGFFALIRNRISFLANVETVSKPSASGFPRIHSIFGEPSFFGSFILITSPIVYLLSKSKKKIFKNFFIDRIIKKSTFILMVLNLLLTQSPIYILFGLIFLGIVFIRKYFKINLKSIIAINFAMLILAGSLFYINSKMSTLTSNVVFLRRIVSTSTFYKDFNKLVIAEPSLATRILAYVCNVTIWYKNPIIGVGYGNLNKEIFKELSVLPLPLTPELEYKISNNDTNVTFTAAIFFRILADTGIVGAFLFYKFLFTLLSAIKKTINYYEGIERDFIIGLKYFMILLIINTFYNSHLHWGFIWLFIGIALAMIIYARNNPQIEQEQI